MTNKIITHIEALEKARNYCAYQERCQQEVIAKLRSFELNSDEINYVLLQLIQGAYLNEERYSRAVVSGKIRIKKWGKRKIKSYLKQRGITDKCIELGFSEISKSEYYGILENLTINKWNKTKESNVFKKRQKVIAYLYGKGFETDLINEVLSNITAEDENNQ